MPTNSENIKLLKAALATLSNQIGTLECDINRAKIDGKTVHNANNLKQQLHYAREEISILERDLFNKYTGAMAQMFRQHSILHSQGTEYLYNDGKIDNDEKEMLKQSAKDLIACVDNYVNVMLEFAEDN